MLKAIFPTNIDLLIVKSIFAQYMIKAGSYVNVKEGSHTLICIYHISDN